MMLTMARESCGMHTCYAKVFECNRASQQGLEKLGFEQLIVSATPPHDDELFYRYGHPAAHDETVRELKRLMRKIRVVRYVSRETRTSVHECGTLIGT